MYSQGSIRDPNPFGDSPARFGERFCRVIRSDRLLQDCITPVGYPLKVIDASIDTIDRPQFVYTFGGMERPSRYPRLSRLALALAMLLSVIVGPLVHSQDALANCLDASVHHTMSYGAASDDVDPNDTRGDVAHPSDDCCAQGCMAGILVPGPFAGDALKQAGHDDWPSTELTLALRDRLDRPPNS